MLASNTADLGMVRRAEVLVLAYSQRLLGGLLRAAYWFRCIIFIFRALGRGRGGDAGFHFNFARLGCNIQLDSIRMAASWSVATALGMCLRESLCRPGHHANLMCRILVPLAGYRVLVLNLDFCRIWVGDIHSLLVRTFSGPSLRFAGFLFPFSGKSRFVSRY